MIWFNSCKLSGTLFLDAPIDKGLIMAWHLCNQAIVWTYDGLLVMEHLKTNISVIVIKIQQFLWEKMNLKILSAKF